MQKHTMVLAFMFIMVLSADAQTVNSDTITVMHTEYPPFTYTDNTGASAGFSLDLLRTMFQEVESTMEVKAYPWKRAEQTLSKKTNTLVFCARIERREKLYDWIGPVYPRTLSLYKLKARSDIQIKDVEDILRYKIGVVRGYASVNELKKIGVREENFEEVSNETLNVKKFFGNRFDLIPINDMVLSYHLRREGHSMNDVEKVFDVSKEGGRDFYFAINRETDALLVEKLRQAFEKIKKDGTYNAVLKNYIH